jgi:hypothetical protein
VLEVDTLKSAQLKDEVVAAGTGFVVVIARFQSAQIEDEVVTAEMGFVVVVVVEPATGKVVVVIVFVQAGSVVDEPPAAGQLPCARAPATRKRSTLALMLIGMTG